MKRWEISLLAGTVAILLYPLAALLLSKLYAPLVIQEAERILER